MKDFSGYEELVSRVAQARRDARDNGPRGSNDDLEAAIFVAMMFALDKWNMEQGSPPPPTQAADDGAQSNDVPLTSASSAADDVNGENDDYAAA